MRAEAANVPITIFVGVLMAVSFPTRTINTQIRVGDLCRVPSPLRSLPIRFPGERPIRARIGIVVIERI